jgi:hypothetical protein
LLGLTDNMLRQAGLGGQFYFRVQPKLGLAVWMSHMNVHPRFFTGEEKESVWSFPKDGWCHEIFPSSRRAEF